MINPLKQKLISRENNLLNFILIALGFGAACGLGSCEYGTPTATFQVNGTVQSVTDSSPISDIQVSMGDETTYTDDSGNYQLIVEDVPLAPYLNVNFQDVDGSENGSFETLDTVVDAGELSKNLDIKLSQSQE